MPASATREACPQRQQLGFLPLGKACRKRRGFRLSAQQQGQRTVAFVDLQLRVDHRDGRRYLGKDFTKACLAFTQGMLGVPHSQQSAQRSQEHVRIDRVNEVGVGPRIQAGDDIAGLDRRCGNVNDRQQPRAVIGSQLPYDVEAAHVRQIHIENQRVDRFGGNQAQSFGARSGFEHGITVALEYPAYCVARGRVVVDDQQLALMLHQRAPWRSPRE